jgi:hypothetical protein
MLKGDCIPSTLPGVSTLLTVCWDGQPSQSRFERRDQQCVGSRFYYSLPDHHHPGTLNNPVLLTVALVKLWHVMGGIYLSVFTFFFSLSFSCIESCYLKLFCPAGSSLLRLTMNGGLFGAIFPTGIVYGSVTMGGSASPESRVDLVIQ